MRTETWGVAEREGVNLEPPRLRRGGRAGQADGAGVTPLHCRRAGPSSVGAPARTAPGSLREAAAEVAERRHRAMNGSNPEATARQRAQGKLTARERIALLLDEGSFVELDPFARHRATGFGMEHRRPDTDGVVTGWGTVDGRQVCVLAHDPGDPRSSTRSW